MKQPIEFDVPPILVAEFFILAQLPPGENCAAEEREVAEQLGIIAEFSAGGGFYDHYADALSVCNELNRRKTTRQLRVISSRDL